MQAGLAVADRRKTNPPGGNPDDRCPSPKLAQLDPAPPDVVLRAAGGVGLETPKPTSTIPWVAPVRNAHAHTGRPLDRARASDFSQHMHLEGGPTRLGVGMVRLPS
jgi:hypothetical protein